jgi:hypothetical protein
MVGALPGGAGKTTVMGALLNFVPPDVRLTPADSLAAIEAGCRERSERRCYICHEIGAGAYYGYLWGGALRRYFDLPEAGHMLATNLHADTYAEARHQVCRQNGVPHACFRRINLFYFLAVDRSGREVRRRISGIWAGDGQTDHELLDKASASTLVPAGALHRAAVMIDALMASGVRRIEDVRAILLAEGTGRTV